MMTFVILKICYIIGKTNICFDWIGKRDYLIEKGVELLVYVQFDQGNIKRIQEFGLLILIIKQTIGFVVSNLKGTTCQFLTNFCHV